MAAQELRMTFSTTNVEKAVNGESTEAVPAKRENPSSIGHSPEAPGRLSPAKPSVSSDNTHSTEVAELSEEDLLLISFANC
jgi:hypothetical protein